MGEETGRASRPIPALILVSAAEFWGLWACLQDNRPADNRLGTPDSGGGKDRCTGLSSHQRAFLDLKRERGKTRLTRDKPGGSTPMFEG